jgi:hypothetical protein
MVDDKAFLAWAKEQHLQCCEERLQYHEEPCTFDEYLEKCMQYLLDRYSEEVVND